MGAATTTTSTIIEHSEIAPAGNTITLTITESVIEEVEARNSENIRSRRNSLLHTNENKNNALPKVNGSLRMRRLSTMEMVAANSFVTQEKGFLMNMILLVYIFIGFPLGLVCLASIKTSWLGYILNVFLIGHIITVSAFLHHELAHGTVFKSTNRNHIIGSLNLWINSGCYFSFAELKAMHVDHHISKVDYEVFNSAELVKSMPRILKSLLYTLEFFMVPAHGFFLRIRAVLGPWWHPDRKHAQVSTAMVFIARLTALIILGQEFENYFWFPLGYFLAHSMAIQIQRFGDCFSHAYEIYPVGTKVERKDKEYDMEKTYSIIFPSSLRWMGVFFMLNFNFHNAHHYNTNVPWYALPVYHDMIDSKTPKNQYELSFSEAISNFFSQRLIRITEDQGAPTLDNGRLVMKDFIGVMDAPFLALEM